jgi:hypothetical protein
MDYEADYQAGKQGKPYSRSMDYYSWHRGLVDARPRAGLTALPGILMAPIFYPIAGAAVVGVTCLFYFAANALGLQIIWVLVGALAIAIGTFVFALGAERYMSRFLVYRVTRALIRLSFVTALVAVLVTVYRSQAYDVVPGALEIGAGLLLSLLALAASLRADHAWGIGRLPHGYRGQPRPNETPRAAAPAGA